MTDLTPERIASAIVLLYAATSAAARMGLVPGRLLAWWQERWLPHQREVTRTAAIDAMLAEMRPNGGDSLRDRVDCIAGKLDQSLDWQAKHDVEATSDRMAMNAHLASTSQHRRD